MIGKIVLCFAAMCFVAVSGHMDPNDPTIAACKTEVDAIQFTGDKKICMRICTSVKKGWGVNADFSFNVAKKLEWANKAFSSNPADLQAFTTAVNACKDVAKGSANYCVAGTKIHECMVANNAPYPKNHEHQ